MEILFHEHLAHADTYALKKALFGKPQQKEE